MSILIAAGRRLLLATVAAGALVLGIDVGSTASRGGLYDVREGRHPLIENPVPNDLQLGETKLLLITGPNMGGKTATLKTLGLAVLMHQCGMFVAAASAKPADKKPADKKLTAAATAELATLQKLVSDAPPYQPPAPSAKDG